jgi:ribosomal protein S18 acetylase RimI-like enzyme
VLPAEELVGALPGRRGGPPRTHRAYFSNVCVADAARRRGVAAALLAAGEALAAAAGVTHMYVHVVAANTAARTLYLDRSGFAVESEEGEEHARKLGRPRRLLLHKPLPPPKIAASG